MRNNMPINFDSLNIMLDTARINLNDNGDFQKASFFSRQSTIDQNKQKIVDSLKQTIASDPKYFGVQKHLEGMIDGLLSSKLSSKDITAGQIKDIMAYADSLATPAEQKKSFMSGAIHTALVMHQNQDSSAKFGLPTALADSSKEIKDCYAKTFHKTFQNLFNETKDLRTVNYENTIRQFDENATLIKDTLGTLDLPNELSNTFFENTIEKNYSKEQLETLGKYYHTIKDDTQLSSSQKNILYGIAAADNAPLEENRLNLLILMRENMFVHDEVSNSPAFTDHIKSELSAMGFDEKSVEHMQKQVKDAVNNDARKLVPYKMDATPEEVQALVSQAIKADAQTIQDLANKELDNYRAAIQEVKNYAKGDAALEKIGLKTISHTPEVPKAGYLTALHEASGKLNPDFKKLTANINTVSLDRFDAVLTLLSKAINEIKIDKALLPELGMLKSNLVDHILGESVNTLSADERRGLFDRLSSPAGENLFYMHKNDNQNADNLFIAQNISLLRDQIALLDNLEAKPFSDDPEPKCDYTKLSASMQAKHSLDNIITGDLPAGDILAGMTTEKYQSRFEGTAQSMLQINFLAEMQKMTGLASGETIFDKDIVRGLDITLPDGKKLEAKVMTDEGLAPEKIRAAQILAAKNQLASYISHGQTENYEELTPAQTRTAQILMACLSQETEKIINMGGPLAFNSEQDMQAFITMENREANQGLEGGGRTFKLVEDGSGGFEIQYQCTRAINFFQANRMGAEPLIDLSPESTEHYELNIHIPGAEIERLQTVDFSTLAELTRSPKVSDLMNWKTNFDFGACNMQNVTITGGFWINGVQEQ